MGRLDTSHYHKQFQARRCLLMLLQKLLNTDKINADFHFLQAQSERNIELATELEASGEAHAKELSRLNKTTGSQLQQAIRENADLRSRNEYLERQLQKAK